MSNKPKRVYTPLVAALHACRSIFVSAAVFSALLNILYLAPTLYMLQVYNRVVPTRGVSTLVLLTLVFIFATATLSLLDYVRARLLIRASARLDRFLSANIISALISRAGSRNRSSQVLREFDTLRATLTGTGILALFDAPWTPIYIIICFIIHPLLGVLTLAGSGSLLFFATLNERSTKAPLQRANEASALSYMSLDHSASAGGVIRALGMRRAMIFRHMNERYNSVHLSAEAGYSGVTYISWIKWVRLTLQSVSLGLGAYLAIEQQISAGAIFAASLLVTRALSPIEQVVGAWRGIVQARAAEQSLTELFEQTDYQENHTLLPEPEGLLQIERVYVATPAGDKVVLNDINFQLEPGAALGIVGPSGAGKSTLVRAIAGAQAINQGAIRFDGANAKDWDEEQLARHVGYLPQDPSLFRGTVKENIARFQTVINPDQAAVDFAVITAAKACGAHEFIVRLPKAYDTELGWNGAGLSAGQAQRIALARALFGEPRIVIMDEPNAHLDAEGEADLLEAIIKLKQRGATVIIVAHRTAVLAAIDKLMVLRDGRIEIMGAPDEVTARLAANRPAAPLQAPAAG